MLNDRSKKRNLKRLALIAFALPCLCFFAFWALVEILLLSNTSKRVEYKPARHFSLQEKLSPAFWLGNSDDLLPPADYLPGDPQRVSKWYLRNPLHNFTFYVIGIADRGFTRVGKSPAENFCEPEGWNWAISQYKFLRLPFISYKSNAVMLYAGWRESGNFGLKFNLLSARYQCF
jgi:hypothetical protein